MLIDTEKKALTEMLGEEWNGVTWYKPSTGEETGDRTFTTWQDFGDVVRAIDKGIILSAFINMENNSNSKMYFVELLQQPDFIEKFMRAVVEMKGGGE
jgi:hypothetical protein